MQFIAKCGIEYGFQFVTRFFFSSPDCLYTKKFCDFLQSYEKSSAKQRNSFLFLPRRSNFAIFDGKVTKKRVKQQKESQDFLLLKRFGKSYEKTSKTAKGKPRFSFAEEIWESEHLQYEIEQMHSPDIF